MTYQEAQAILATKQDDENTPEQQAALDFIIEVANLKPISRRQAKQQLLIMGKLDAVQSAIDAIPDPVHKGLAQIYWDDSQVFERRHPMMMQIGAMIGLDDQAMNTAFREAAKL